MKTIVFAFFVFSLLTGCLKNPENDFTCNYDECSTKAPASEIEQVQAYLAANNITATQHCSGMFYVIDNPGNGSSPSVCNSVLVNYKGSLTNGTVFDNPADPVGFRLAGVIPGFRNGVPLIKTGGKVRLFIPPSLGYGNNPPQGSNIPAGAILIFEVSLLQVQ